MMIGLHRTRTTGQVVAHHPRARRGRAADRSRGAVLIEAAIVTPLFFILVFGIIDVGLALNDDLALSHATRAGSRVASASGNDLYADYGIIQTIRREGAALPKGQIERVVVYRPSAPGEGPTASCKAGTSSAGTGAAHVGACNAYSPADMAKPKTDFGCLPAQQLDKYWCPTVRDVSLDNGTDYVGVWIQVRHPYVTRIFGTAVTLTDQSIIRLEPRVKA